MKIAFVYDWFDSWGGIERILLLLHAHYPHAQWYTSYKNTHKQWWPDTMDIRTSFLQRLPAIIRENRMLSAFMYPYAFESFDFTGYDVVVSITSSYAKGIITRPKTRHISLLLTPTRFLWVMPHIYAKNPLIQALLTMQRTWDRIAAERPDELYAISREVQRRIQTYYGRTAEVLSVPFDKKTWDAASQKLTIQTPDIQNKYSFLSPKEYYLNVGRLEGYKSVSYLIDAFRTLQKKLVIVGEGRQRELLQTNAPANVHFVGKVSDIELAWLYTHAQALIMPQEEDFGLVSLEAQYFKTPVIAYGKGGALETVEDGKTGVFYAVQKPEALQRALARHEALVYNEEHFSLKHEFTEEYFITQFAKILGL